LRTSALHLAVCKCINKQEEIILGTASTNILIKERCSQMKSEEICDAHSANGETRNAYRFVVGNLLSRELGTHRCRSKVIFNYTLKK
jgi:hypothetical protein